MMTGKCFCLLTATFSSGDWHEPAKDCFFPSLSFLPLRILAVVAANAIFCNKRKYPKRFSLVWVWSELDWTEEDIQHTSLAAEWNVMYVLGDRKWRNVCRNIYHTDQAAFVLNILKTFNVFHWRQKPQNCRWYCIQIWQYSFVHHLKDRNIL